MHPAPRALLNESAHFEGWAADHELHEGWDLDGFLHDSAVGQGGLSTAIELAALPTPLPYLPVRNRFERQRHVAGRLDGLGARTRLECDDTTAEALAAAILERLGTPVHAAPVATGGTERAARMLAGLL